MTFKVGGNHFWQKLISSISNALFLKETWFHRRIQETMESRETKENKVNRKN